jgi:hypothetical protein
MMTATFLATLFLPLSASALGLEAAKTAAVEKRRLATVPQDATLKKIYLSPDTRRLGFIARRGAKEFAVVDGVSSEDYDALSPLTFSPDARSVAFIARNGLTQFAVIDGLRGEPFDRVEAEIGRASCRERVSVIV